MEQYKNLGGGSGVSGFMIKDNLIIIEFSTGATYEYTTGSVGATNLKRMKQLATKGSGLNSFINTRVKNNYSRKIS